ncbi:HPr family phosphocarrier protein [Hellea sp.]|nr:HPr family phosphocarrier protein [Hellea sp.]
MSTTVTATVKLINKRGLHARASNKFMECVMRFNAEVLVRSHNDVFAETVVADSVMELLLLGAACGEDITVSATGEDAQPAVSALVELVEDRFGESE